MGYYGYFDSAFLILVLPAILFSLAMSFWVKSAYRKQSRPNARHITGAAAAQRVLRQYGIHDVRVEPVRGNLTDHYDPRQKVIRLSEGVYQSATVAAVGIAAHEAGHAAQHARQYMPIRVRNAILPACNIGSSLGPLLVFLGFVFSRPSLITIGLGLFALVALFQLVTLPVEFNASRRALRVIEETSLLEGDDYKGAKKVLQAAAMTYVAALAVSIANLLRLWLQSRRRR